MDKISFRTLFFKLLFQIEFCKPEELSEKLSLFLDDRGIHLDKDRKEFEDKFNDVMSHIDELDAKIEAYSNGWRKERIGKVELALLRLASYEILYDKVADSVAINAAVELTKRYVDEKAAKFVNGILGNVAREKDA